MLHLGQSNTRHNYKLGEERLKSSPVRKSEGTGQHQQLSVSQQCILWQYRAQIPLGSITHSIASRPRGVIILIYSMLVQPQPKHWVQCWVPPLKKAVKVLEYSQRRIIKLTMRLEGMSSEEQLRTLGLCVLEKRSLSGDFIALYSSLQREGEREMPGIQW